MFRSSTHTPSTSLYAPNPVASSLASTAVNTFVSPHVTLGFAGSSFEAISTAATPSTSDFVHLCAPNSPPIPAHNRVEITRQGYPSQTQPHNIFAPGSLSVGASYPLRPVVQSSAASSAANTPRRTQRRDSDASSVSISSDWSSSTPPPRSSRRRDPFINHSPESWSARTPRTRRPRKSNTPSRSRVSSPCPDMTRRTELDPPSGLNSVITTTPWQQGPASDSGVNREDMPNSSSVNFESDFTSAPAYWPTTRFNLTDPAPGTHKSVSTVALNSTMPPLSLYDAPGLSEFAPPSL